MVSLLRRVLVLATATLTLLPPATAFAHEGHAALPEGFRADIAELRDESGTAVDLPGVRLRVAPGGIGLTVTNTGGQVVEVMGEQAGEPLVRVAAARAWVNQTSPQAKDVEGAAVDTGAAAELIDLVWKRAKPDWVRLPQGGTVTLIDHRGAPGHQPVRSEYATGDVAGEFRIAFTADGTAYTAAGVITATALPSSPKTGLALLVVALLLVAAVVAGGLWLRRSRTARTPARRSVPQPSSP